MVEFAETIEQERSFQMQQQDNSLMQQNDQSVINMSAIEQNEVANSITSVEKDFLDQTELTEQQTRVPGQLLEESKIVIDQSGNDLMALPEEALAEAEEAKRQVAAAEAREQSSFYQAREVGATGATVETSKLQEYIQSEVQDLASDIVVYNVLQCPKGAIQGDAREIKHQLERSYSQTASVMLESFSELESLLPNTDFKSEVDKVMQLLMCTNKGVFLTSLAPNPDGKPESRKIKQVSKIYDKTVKFMQIYKQILFIVGSDLNVEDNKNDFSAKQLTIIQENNSKILARLRFNEDIVFFKIQQTILIVSAGGGLYIFDLSTFKKLESL